MRSRAGWRLLAEGLRGSRRALGRIAALSVVEALPALLTGWLLAFALDQGFLAGRPRTGFAWLGALLAAMLVGALATRLVFPHLAAVVEPLRDRLVRRVVEASLHAPGTRATGADAAAVSRVTEQVEDVRRLVSALLRTARQLGLAVVATVVGVTVLSPMLTLLVAPPLVVALVLFAFLVPRLVERQRAAVLADEAVARETTRALHGLRDVLACQAVRRTARDVGAAVDAEAAAARALARASALRVLVVALGVQTPLVALLATGPSLVRGGHVSTGGLVAAASYLTVTLAPALHSLVQVTGSWGLQLAVVLGRLAETTPRPAPAQVRAGARRPRGHTLVVSGVTFAYAPHSAPVLDRFDLTVHGEDHLAVVGPSGVGKSTLTDLLAGLVQPRHGQVRLGGVALPDWDEGALRREVALIPQEAYVFAGTLRENVTHLAADLTRTQLELAAETLGLDALMRRVGGWDEEIVPGDLAAGERQLVALARAYLSPASVMILDEACCHLDPRAEERVERAFARRPGALVVVAHRISSALRARRVLVLDGAAAVEGTHAQLLERSPLYRDLVGYWQADDDGEPAMVTTLRSATSSAPGSDAHRNGVRRPVVQPAMIAVHQQRRDEHAEQERAYQRPQRAG